MMNQRNSITEDIIWKQLLLFCFPIMLGTLFQQLYNAVDVIVVGQFVGEKALASVGASSQIVNMIVNLFVGISSGTTVIVSRFYGGNDFSKLKKAMDTSIIIAFVGGIIFSVLGFIFTPLFLELLKTPTEIMKDSILYLRIYFSGLIFIFIYNIASSILRAMGDSKRPLYYLIICCFVNIFLDIILVIIFHLGVMGVALATIIAQAISCYFVIKALMNLNEVYCFIFRSIHFHQEIFNSICYIGFPAGFQSFMNSISSLLMASAINVLGTNAVAGNTAYAKLDGIFWMISTAFSVAIATFVGQNFGAKKYDRMKKSIWVCLGLDIGLSIGLSFFFLICGPLLFYLFTNNSKVILRGMEVLKAIAPYYGLVAFYEIFTSALRGMDDVIIPMIINIIGLCIIRILWILLIVPKHQSLYVIILSCPISWFITAILLIIYFLYKYRKFNKSYN